MVTWDSEDDIANNIDDGQRVYRNFAGTYFPGDYLETVKVVYEALALEDGVMRPVQNQFYGWTHHLTRFYGCDVVPEYPHHCIQAGVPNLSSGRRIKHK